MHARVFCIRFLLLAAGASLGACDEEGTAAAADGAPPVDSGPAVDGSADAGIPPDATPDAAPDMGDPGALSSVSVPTRAPEWYVEQALIYFDTLDTRADPDIVPEYAPDVARWEWPPWLYLTGWGAQQMVATTRAALRIDPSIVEERDCRFFPTQPFARCYVDFIYDAGNCPIYEEFTFNDAGEMTFLEAWSVMPGRMPVEDYAADRWAEGEDADRLSTRIPGLGRPDGAIVLDAPWMDAAAADDPEVADFVRRASDFWTTWREAYDEAGEDVYAIGCGWDMPHGEAGPPPSP